MSSVVHNDLLGATKLVAATVSAGSVSVANLRLAARHHVPPTIPSYQAGTKYKAGDQVHQGNAIYECRPWPYTPWCGLAAYAPNSSIGHHAWITVGPYAGGGSAVPAPPVPVCPEYKAGSEYKANDCVTLNGKRYQCKGWPYTPWCKQAAYRPGGLYWKSAWTAL
jgi:hypothetical protein